MPREKTENAVTGRIFKIERGCTHDGPGIRTVVYLKGCPLRCAWCANAEGIDQEFSIQFEEERCADCGRCAAACPGGSIGRIRAYAPREGCLGYGCGKCVLACPNDALKAAGRLIDAGELADIVKSDFSYYLESGGGVTFSGGEPLMQPDFLGDTLRRLKRSGVDTAIETSGFASTDILAQLLPYIDHVMLDIKHMDSALHQKHTSVPNGRILENARYIAARHKDLMINLPLMPGVNDDESNLHALGRFIRDDLRTVSAIRLLPYHNYGEVKYRRLGITCEYSAQQRHSQKRLEEIKEVLQAYVKRVQLRS